MIDETIGTLIRHWWLFALRAAIALLFGVLTLFNPALTVTALVLLFGAYAMAIGIFTIVAAVTRRRGERHWLALVVSGALSIALGVITLLTPRVTSLLLLYLIAAWAIVTGISEITTAVRLRRIVTGEWLLVLAGVVSVLFGVLLAVFPGAGAIAVALWIGTYAIMLGVLWMALALRLRSWGREHRPAAERAS